MISDLVGCVVIIEHPYLYNTHLLAKIDAVTAKTMMVRYWHSKRGWSEDASRRKAIPSIIMVGKANEISDLSLNRAQERMVSYRSEAVERERAAWQSYAKKIKEMTV